MSLFDPDEQAGFAKLDQAGGASLVIDDHYRVLYATKPVLDLLKVPAGQTLVGTLALELIPEDRRRIVEIGVLARGGKMVDFPAPATVLTKILCVDGREEILVTTVCSHDSPIGRLHVVGFKPFERMSPEHPESEDIVLNQLARVQQSVYAIGSLERQQAVLLDRLGQVQQPLDENVGGLNAQVHRLTQVIKVITQLLRIAVENADGKVPAPDILGALKVLDAVLDEPPDLSGDGRGSE